jgi:hypothetical protein
LIPSSFLKYHYQPTVGQILIACINYYGSLFFNEMIDEDVMGIIKRRQRHSSILSSSRSLSFNKSFNFANDILPLLCDFNWCFTMLESFCRILWSMLWVENVCN